ncbi:MAG: type II/IV secretion system ATPase subunit [Methanocellales archaeon]
MIKIESKFRNLGKLDTLELLSGLNQTEFNALSRADGNKKLLGRIINVLRFNKGYDQLEPYDPAKHGILAALETLKDNQEIKRYWIDEPFSFVVLLYEKDKKRLTYNVIEPALTKFEKELLERLNEDLQDILTLENISSDLFSKIKILKFKILQLLTQYGLKLETSSIYKILYYIYRNYLGYGKIHALLRDPYIEDVSCDGAGIPIFLYHRLYRNIKTNIAFEEEELNSFVIKIAQRSGKHISLGNPLINATLSDGSRLQATLGREITTRGSSFTIRKFREDPFTPIDLINYGTFSAEMLAYLWLAIENNKSLIFAGGTASGKTSSLNAVSLFIPPLAKIVSIEDTRELTLYQENWIASVTRDTISKDGVGEVDMYELLRQAMRQRPEYLIVGEVRGKEALTLFQAMSTGHATYSTLHAGSVQEAVNRLENEPINVPRVMISSLDILCLQILIYLKGERVRRVMQITEFTGLDPRTGNLRINEAFKWDPITDKFVRPSDSYVLRDIMQRRGWSYEELMEELSNREKVLSLCAKLDIRDLDRLSMVIQSYLSDPKRVIKAVEDGNLNKILG